MKLGFTKKQVVSTLKTAGYIALSAGIDFLLSATTGTQFGPLTGIINLGLVAFKQFITEEKAK